nr:signal peptide peptidase SppA [Saprospiraceae bacterium]
AAGELNEQLRNFSATGKQVFVHGTYFSQGEYYLASAADHISLNPFGMIDFRGFGILATFMPDFFGKLGVDFNVYTAGDYKGAGETFHRRSFSDENREQLTDILNSAYELFLEEISINRNIPVEKLKDIANNLQSRDDRSALELRLVDAVENKHEFKSRIKSSLGLDEDKKLNTISAADYFNSTKSDRRSSADDQIAVIYAEGTILGGSDEGGMISDEVYVKAIQEIIDNDNIKSVVLRVNSGGGSVIASDNIYRALVRLTESGKQLVVSMGDVAASGGYYIACASDHILAEPQTITGSIGVFFLLVNLNELVQDKLEIHLDSISTGPYALKFNPLKEFDDAEHEYYQQLVEETYDRFINLVAESRDKTYDEIHQVAQGRIWMAEDALSSGLIDQIGDLQDAIELAASLGQMDEYRLRTYPQIKDPFLRFIEDLTGESIALEDMAIKRLSSTYRELSAIEELRNMPGLQSRIPYIINYN